MMSVLLITNKSDITTDFIVKELKRKGVNFYRLNTEEIGQTIQLSFDFQAGRFFLFDQITLTQLDLLQFKSVFFRRPEVREHFNDLDNGETDFIRSELFFCLEGIYKILDNAFWLNKIDHIRKAENKIYQLLVAQEIGFKIPNSVITNIPEDALSFYMENNSECIIKPIRTGLISNKENEEIIFTSKVELDDKNASRVQHCPVYLQRLIPKKADIRITVVGTKIFAAKIHSQGSDEAKVDWRKALKPLVYTAIELPTEICEKCFELVKRLQLNFGAIDMILDLDDNFIFLEVNPNGQWAWLERQLNFLIAETITNILIEKAA
jgi:glutathione synthase/RimK-type ligase-like ATP-grasp enzyme